jgi:hypothetical protein
MEILASALQGLSNAEAQVDQAAARISQAGTSGSAAPGDAIDMAAAVVELTVGKEDYLANLKALQTGDEMAKHTIDILA